MFKRVKNQTRYNIMPPLKLVLVGDGMVGKSAICKSYIRKSPYLIYHPTISETHEITITIHKEEYSFVIWDTAGVEEWDNLRTPDYVNTDCFILCYAINNPTSFSNIETRWIPEIRAYAPNVPILLVGTQADRRTPANRWISPEEGIQLKSRIRAAGFAECTSKSIASIEGVFIQACVIADKYREMKLQNGNNTTRCMKRCTLL